MSSIRIIAHFTQEITRFGRERISGTELRKAWNGMTQIPSQPGVELSN